LKKVAIPRHPAEFNYLPAGASARSPASQAPRYQIVTIATARLRFILACMAVSVTVLASGSKGNCTLISSNATRLLVDAGLSCRELLRRLRRCGESPGGIDAILISHEHGDHINGLRVLAKRLRVPVYMTADTHEAYRRSARDSAGHRVKLERLETFRAGCAFQIGDVVIMPFTTPHDAVDPVAFTFVSEGIKAGICTDLGYMPASVRHHLRGCHMLMIESNHDVEMLRGGPYPWSIKQRVMSRVGHLSNDALADFFATDYDGGAEFLILAHLSEENNHPEIARMTAERALGEQRTFVRNQVMLASQHEPLPPIRL
jgi:phosphoribosyl 1,2-cyclic phosphodiesterase